MADKRPHTDTFGVETTAGYDVKSAGYRDAATAAHEMDTVIDALRVAVAMAESARERALGNLFAQRSGVAIETVFAYRGGFAVLVCEMAHMSSSEMHTAKVPMPTIAGFDVLTFDDTVDGMDVPPKRVVSMVPRIGERFRIFPDDHGLMIQFNDDHKPWPLDGVDLVVAIEYDGSYFLTLSASRAQTRKVVFNRVRIPVVRGDMDDETFARDVVSPIVREALVYASNR